MKRLQYDLTVEDYARFSFYVSVNSDLYKSSLRRNRILVSVIFLVVSLYLFKIQSTATAIVYVVFGLLWYLAYPMRARQQQSAHSKKFAREFFGGSKTKRVVLETRPDGLYASTQKGESKNSYSAVEKIVEDGGNTYIYVDRAVAFILPHDRIPERDRNEFLAEIKQGKEK